MKMNLSTRVWKNVDIPLLTIVTIMMAFGLVMVYSASWAYSFYKYSSEAVVFLRQLVWLVVGLGAAVVINWMDYHKWQHLAVWGMAFTVIALFAVLIFGESLHGATRTFIHGSVQPSELAKLMTIIYLSVWLTAKKDQLNQMSYGLIPLGVILAFMGSLIYVQPDLSAVVTVLFLGIALFFLANASWRQIILLLIIGGLAGSVMVQFHSTGNRRMKEYIAGLADPVNGGSDHYHYAVEAIVSGGWLGAGLGLSEGKIVNLPVPQTDSIFAVIAEELGVVGAATVIMLFGVFLWRGLTIARDAPDLLGQLMASGITIWIVWEAYLNIGVMLGLVPFTGNALPFFSAGGSNLVTSWIGIGLLNNISRQSQQMHQEQRRPWFAVVNLRGRNRRRSVSRSVHSAGAATKTD